MQAEEARWIRAASASQLHGTSARGRDHRARGCRVSARRTVGWKVDRLSVSDDGLLSGEPDTVAPVTNTEHDSPVVRLLDAIPTGLRDLSGTALYTGLSSWTTPSPLYLMGINPGGEPGDDTIYGNAINTLNNLPANFSAYRDEEWGHARGQHPMQRSVLHVFDGLGLDPGMVPTSNMVYAAADKRTTSLPAPCVNGQRSAGLSTPR